MPSQPPKISNFEAGLMIAVALIIDIVQFLLDLILIGFILDPIISVFAYLMFWFWFKLRGVSFSNPKRAAIGGISFLLELIPGLDMLPALTVGVVMTYLSTKVKIPGL